MLGIWPLRPNSRLGVSPSEQVRETGRVTELAGGQARMPAGVWPQSRPSPRWSPSKGHLSPWQLVILHSLTAMASLTFP